MLTLSVTGITHCGTKRSVNEDRVYWDQDLPDGRLLGAVADGMGGYEGGEIASALAIKTFATNLEHSLERTSAVSPDVALQNAVMQANRQVQVARTTEPGLAKMGTTLVAALVDVNGALVIHVGDSRCYHFTGGQFELKTRDDTVVQNMLDQGEITEADIPRVPFRNVLTRALGIEGEIQPSLCRVPLAPGDTLILCSDGVPEALPTSCWASLIADQVTLEEQAQAMINACLENQASDNISLVLIHLSDAETSN